MNIDQNKANKTQDKNISVNTNSNLDTKSLRDKENKEKESKIISKKKISNNINLQNINNIINSINLNLKEKRRYQSVNSKNKQKYKYKRFDVISIHSNHNEALKNLNNSMNESDQNKKLNISYHNKSKSGFNSSIKFPGLHCNIFNIKNGNFQRTNNNIGKVKNFKSISPKIQRRNLNNCALKMKYKSKNQQQIKKYFSQ